ncbi:hypothetical protein GCM10025767_32600 [Thalassotalea piscium]|uniref:Uncharacterized protein n=1 Tax=Thalassotalea piscium TaxID=1230533 RepID=A0A7X0NJ30_9GAMM|nr:hypothetical protein [Thalassotalea piscium]
MKINALYLTVFTAYKIDHLINETGMIRKNDIKNAVKAYTLTALSSLNYNYFCSLATVCIPNSAS